MLVNSSGYACVRAGVAPAPAPVALAAMTAWLRVRRSLAATLAPKTGGVRPQAVIDAATGPFAPVHALSAVPAWSPPV